MRLELKNKIIYILINCILTTSLTFLCLYEFPVMYVDMNVILGILVVPVGAFLCSVILSGLMKLLRFKVTWLTIVLMIVVAPTISTFFYVFSLGSTVSKYFSHLYYSRIEYERAVSKKMIYHLANAQVEDSLKKKLQVNYVVTNAITDNNDTDLVIFETMAPSIIYGNVLYDGVYRVKEDRITDLVSTDDIWELMLNRDHLPINSNFNPEYTDQNFNNREINFLSNELHKTFNLTWVVKNDKIQIQDVHSEQATVYKGQ